ncbi:MAG TPA: ferric reductase-like transmembrane domain-containing protein [Kofleriaceae bacterium]|nr:ferric reductase-like transmembrane domain-containing protein [Kofleriaceae bacterium]
MSTSDTGAARALPLVDGRFAKKLVIACGLVPGGLLIWDAYHGQLGVNSVNFAIRSTGMLGLVFLMLALLVTPVRRLTGWNGLIAIRRNLGVFGFVYILAHLALFFWFDRDHDVADTLHEIGARVYLWFGTGALVLMIPLTITSTDRMVTRLGARRWKLLHRLSYVVVFGGLVHFYLLVKADTSKPFAFSVVFGGLMAFRIVRHYFDVRAAARIAQARAVAARAGTQARRKKFWSGELVLARIFQETHDVKTFRLVAGDGGPLPFEHAAGQYLNLALTIDGRRVNRSYTIASSPTDSAYCEISVKRVAGGKASVHLHDTWTEGMRIRVSAPAGRFGFTGHQAGRVVLIAGGIGITPMMSVIRGLTDRCWPGDIYLIYSVRRHRDLAFGDELAALQRRFPNLHVRITLSQDPDQPWDGARGHVSHALLEDFLPAPIRGPVLLCGPAPMMVATRALLVDLGVPDADVHEEAFVSPPAVPDDAAGAADPAPVDVPGDGAPLGLTFQRSGQTAELAGGLTVLEAAEEAGVAIPFECRSGICGQCKTRLISGKVVMEVQDALTGSDRARGIMLACQARAAQDLVVDA